MKISDLKKDFEKFTLHIESLSIPDGKVCGIIGSNGCGKTTAMKLMAGIIEPDSGNIDRGGLSPLEITMVFRKPYLLHDTVLRNLIYPLKIRKVRPDKEQIDYYLEMAGLQNIRDQYAPGLSGGEQQKLSLIRAFILSPKLIFVDEAFSNMDIESVARFEEHILNMQKTKPITWVIVSHQLSNIKRLCEYVFFMHEGRIKVSGSPDDILPSPEDDDLKRYLQYI